MGKPWPLLVALVVLSACGSGTREPSPPLDGRIVELPGAAGEIDFDDIVYSPQLQKVLVPARESGLYLVDPETTTATRVPNTGSGTGTGTSSVASADEGRGALFLADRSAGMLTAVNPADGAVLASAPTSAPPDYVRYIEATDELWVTEPDAAGIEVFAFSDEATPTPRPVGFIAVAGGPEGFTTSPTSKTAYTHAGSDLVAIDLATRTVTARWATGCDGTHGFPRVDDRLGVVLASCADNGAVSLLDLDDGRQLGRYEVGGGEALPAHSDRTGHFYVRSDPGTILATLRPSENGLTLVREVTVPEVGHCLTADDRGHYWTCDAQQGRVLRLPDSAAG
jgi:hypothetical protein